MKVSKSFCIKELYRIQEMNGPSGHGMKWSMKKSRF